MDRKDVMLSATAKHIDDETLEDIRISMNGASNDILHLISIIVEEIARSNDHPSIELYLMLALSAYEIPEEEIIMDIESIRKAVEQMRGDK